MLHAGYAISIFALLPYFFRPWVNDSTTTSFVGHLGVEPLTFESLRVTGVFTESGVSKIRNYLVFQS